jgi:hypothetical protein
MKNFLLFLSLFFITELSFGQGDAPPFAQGQGQTSKSLSSILEAPNYSVTKTSSSKALLETGNYNLLGNPSNEHSTFDFNWTNSGCVYTAESTVVIHGKKSSKAVCTAQTLSTTQDSVLYQAQFADGVQGVAMVRIKSDIALNVCARQAGVTSTNCVTTSTDSKWALYKIPFVLGATSNGISIASSGNVTGTVYIDDAFVGVGNILDTQPLIGPWTSYTPTFTGFGTVTSVETKWRQVGSNIEISGSFITGTVSASTASITLPNSYTTAGTSVIPSLQVAGVYQRNASNGNGLILIEANSTTIFPSAAISTINGLAKINGSSLAGSTEKQSFFATVPIAGLAGSTNTYTAPCGANCVDKFVAKVDASGNVTGENIDWINGNASISDTSLYTFTFNTSIFTVAPVCTYSIISNATNLSTEIKHNTDPSATTLVIRTFASSDSTAFSKTAYPHQIECSKTGADFTASRTIQGSFKDVVTIPSSGKPLIYTFEAAANGTVSNELGDLVNGNCTNANPSVCTFNSSKFSVTPMCIATLSNSSAAACFCGTESTSTSGVSLRCYSDAGASCTTANKNVSCTGVSP